MEAPKLVFCHLLTYCHVRHKTHDQIQISSAILNRVVTWDREGIWYEPDQRHADIIIRELGLKADSKGVVTPGEKVKGVVEGLELSDTEATMYRALTARGVYLAQDRSDITFAVKELSRSMSKPTREDWGKLKRLGRYLVDKPLAATQFTSGQDAQGSCAPRH